MKSIASIAVLVLASSCVSMFDMSPTPDAVIAAEEAAKVANLVKKLHEPPHTSFFGAQAEGEREEAADTLGEMKAYIAIPDLAHALKDPNHQVRANAAYALWTMADHAQAAEPALREALKDNWTNVNLFAAWALWDMKVGGPELIPVLKELCASKDGYAAVRAADLGILIEEDPTDFLQCLMRGMLDSDQSMRVIAVMRDETPLYKAYLPVLLQGTRSGDSEVRSESANLLGAGIYASPEVTGVLFKMATSDENETVRINAVQSLVTGGDGREAGIPAGTAEGTGGETIALLVLLLQGHDWQVRAMSASALSNARAGTAEVVAALIGALKDPVNEVRVAAVRALAHIETPAAKPALSAAWSDYVKLANSKADVSGNDIDFYRTVWSALMDLGERPEGAPSP